MFCSLEIKIQETTPVISLVSLIAKGVKEEKNRRNEGGCIKF